MATERMNPVGVLRRATLADLPVICKLGAVLQAQHHQAVPELFTPVTDPMRDADFWQARLQRQEAGEGAFWLWQAGEQVVALMVIRLLDERSMPHLQPMLACQIQSLVVLPDWQGRGIGKALLRQAEDWACEQGALEIRLDVFLFNQLAIELYQRCGYQPRLQHMSKRLGATSSP